MAEIRHIHSRAQAEDAASRWIARLESDDVTEADREQFKAWIESDPLNRETFEAMRFTWHRLDALSHEEPQSAGAQKPGAPVGARRKLVSWASAALVLVAIGLVVFWQTAELGVTHYETNVGEQATYTLADGSQVQLNTNTRLAIRYTAGTRTIDLLRGEAHFDVARDPSRPFVVHAGSGLIRAVGTAFNVYVSDEEAVEVTVTEGVVEVLKEGAHEGAQSRDPHSPAATRITHSHRLSYDAARIETGQVAAVPVANVDRQLAWRQGMLAFDGQSLEVVVREVRRYTDVQFEFEDSTLADVKVGGYFRATDTDAFLELLRSALGIESRRAGERIFLYTTGQ